MRSIRSSISTDRIIHPVLTHPSLFHLILWLSVMVILSVLVGLNGRWPFYFYLLNMVLTLPAMVFFTYTMEWVGNKFLFGKRKIGLFFFIFLLMTVSCSLLIPVIHHVFFFDLFFPRIFEPVPWFNWKLIPQNLILLWFPFFIISIKTFFVNWFRSEQEKLMIENKRLLAEIQLMKIKLHPHFLFNTLNNLYSMSKINCERTSDYILKLSEIYRTMLYECNQEYYPLVEELGLIRNYIELERIRHDERLVLNLNFPTEWDETIMLPPLLLFTFVENAFKHGSQHQTGGATIDISVSFDEDFLIFSSRNSIANPSSPKKGYGGFGLENTKKRLDLIFEDEYFFRSGPVGECYEVYLKIPNLHAS